MWSWYWTVAIVIILAVKEPKTVVFFLNLAFLAYVAIKILLLLRRSQQLISVLIWDKSPTRGQSGA
ncbi:MAG: Uncharacterised protein [Gammaproteobacteria bacterium]|nr:MAG: Uncharacterised protein [Gammaproteobacteria bacterium]